MRGALARGDDAADDDHPRLAPMRKLRLIFWALTAAYWALIATLTHLPPRDVPHVPVDDKAQHFLAYGGLSAILGFALWATFPQRRALPFVVLGIALVYGALDEQTQALVGRTPDLDDWLADAAGAMAGVLPVTIVQRVFERRLRPRAPGRARSMESDTGATFAPELEAAIEVFAEGEAPDRAAARAGIEPRRGRRRARDVG